MREILFYPCIVDSHGRILRKLTNKPTTKEKAEDFLKNHFLAKWRNCEAIPQPETMRNLHH
jgi:hypothetical protein